MTEYRNFISRHLNYFIYFAVAPFCLLTNPSAGLAIEPAAQIQKFDSDSGERWRQNGFTRALSAVRIAPERNFRLDARYALCTDFNIAARRVDADGRWVDHRLEPGRAHDCGYLEDGDAAARIRLFGKNGVIGSDSGVSFDLRAKPKRLLDLSVKW